jgi:hypothetical protein
MSADELVRWLRAQLDEDERHPEYEEGSMLRAFEDLHLAFRRLLLEIGAAIGPWPIPVLMARRFVDRPGYRQEWAP